MSLRSEDVILAQIVAAIDGAIAYAAVSKAEFLSDPMRQDAVIRKLEVRDLASTDANLEAAMAPDVDDWRAAAGMRDRLIHKYWAIDMDIVWATVATDLPRLRAAAVKLQGRARA